MPAASVPEDRPVARKRTRLRADERHQQILHGAIHYFAEAGFAGHTRELSRRLGITQPLLYSYFKSKQDLIDQVYLHVFMGRLQPHWLELLEDESRPLGERLVDFYGTYSSATYRPEWIRIYLFAGLEGGDLNRRYLKRVKSDLLVPCCRQLRRHCGIKDSAPVSDRKSNFSGPCTMASSIPRSVKPCIACQWPLPLSKKCVLPSRPF
ncbi:TetR/AcrR family transcriptional regulator [Piscinibacter sakaiensis]|uniref:TetR/AcrR family transcriptional regulator n=1 Tax=Piscinibacter sakaiensis TaxID=1547922 RepID=UPI003AAE07EB